MFGRDQWSSTLGFLAVFAALTLGGKVDFLIIFGLLLTRAYTEDTEVNEKGFSTLLRLMMEILVVCSLALQLYIKIWELERSIKFLNIYFFFLFLLSFLSFYFSKVDARKARRKGSILKGVAVVKRLRTTGTCDHKYVSVLGV